MTAFGRYLSWSSAHNRGKGSTAPEHQPQNKAELAAFLMFDILEENGVHLGMIAGNLEERMDKVIERMAPVN